MTITYNDLRLLRFYPAYLNELKTRVDELVMSKMEFNERRED